MSKRPLTRRLLELRRMFLVIYLIAFVGITVYSVYDWLWHGNPRGLTVAVTYGVLGIGWAWLTWRGWTHSPPPSS